MSKEINVNIIDDVQGYIKDIPFHSRKPISYFTRGTYRFMRRMCKEHDNFYKNFLSLNNGGFYIRPTSDERFSINRGDYKGIVSADAFGIIASLLSIKARISFNDLEDAKYDQLKDYACQHREKAEILAAVNGTVY